MATSISEAPDAGAFDPTWRLPIAVQGNSSPFSTSALILQQGVGGPFLPLAGNATVTGPVVFNVTPPSIADGVADFDFIHQTPSLTSVANNLHFVDRIILEPGANDATRYWGLGVRARTSSTSTTANMVGVYSQSWRLAGSSAPIWGAIAEASDFTGLNSADVGAATNSMEMDLGVSGLDNITNSGKWGGFGDRQLVHFVVVANQTGPGEAEVSTGLWFGTNGARIDSVIGFQNGTRIYSALDSRGALAPLGVTDPVAAVRMTGGHCIDFNGGPALNSPPSRYWRYIPGLTSLRYFADGGAELFRIQDDSTVISPGSFLAPIIQVTGDQGLVLTNQAGGGGGVQTATLTNAPTAGNPTFWLQVMINGVVHKIPTWT